ncbi:MAG: isochorismatase family protein, partial [Clostridia bacterium]
MKTLFVIDMQEIYIGARVSLGYRASLLADVNKRIEQCLNRGELIVYIKNKKKVRSLLYTPEFAEGLLICSRHVFEKAEASPFGDGKLSAFLRAKNVRLIETIGLDGNCCVAATALDARKEGFDVLFPCAYIGVRNADRFATKKEQLKKMGVHVIEPQEPIELLEREEYTSENTYS